MICGDAMKKFLIFLSLCIMYSCGVHSLNPLFTNKDLIELPEIVGTWKQKSSDEYITFIDSRHMVISAKWTDEFGNERNDSLFLDLRIGKLAEKYWMDTRVKSTNVKTGVRSFYSQIIPSHKFSNLEISNDTLFLQSISNKWLIRNLKNKKVNIASTFDDSKMKESVILTATTEEIQDFILKFQDDEDFFNKKYALVMIK